MHSAQGLDVTCTKTNKWRKDFLECIILRKNLNSSANGDNNLIPPLQIAHFNCHICRMQNNFVCIVMLWHRKTLPDLREKELDFKSTDVDIDPA